MRVSDEAAALRWSSKLTILRSGEDGVCVTVQGGAQERESAGTRDPGEETACACGRARKRSAQEGGSARAHATRAWKRSEWYSAPLTASLHSRCHSLAPAADSRSTYLG